MARIVTLLADTEASENAVEHGFARVASGQFGEGGPRGEQVARDQVDVRAAGERLEGEAERAPRFEHGVGLAGGSEVRSREIFARALGEQGERPANAFDIARLVRAASEGVAFGRLACLKAGRPEIAFIEQDEARPLARALQEVGRFGRERRGAVDDDERERRRSEGGLATRDARRFEGRRRYAAARRYP